MTNVFSLIWLSNKGWILLHYNLSPNFESSLKTEESWIPKEVIEYSVFFGNWLKSFFSISPRVNRDVFTAKLGLPKKFAEIDSKSLEKVNNTRIKASVNYPLINIEDEITQCNNWTLNVGTIKLKTDNQYMKTSI